MVSVDNWGTFDIANFGDLLFPLILQQELGKRLGEVAITLSSPRGGQFPPDPERPVRRIVRMEQADFFGQALRPSAIVLGGGDIFRCDDAALASLYETSFEEASELRFMRAFMFDLGLLARAAPVFWNAVGVPIDFSPETHAMVRKAVQPIRYLSVRDEASKKRLEAAGVEKDVNVVPDSSFLLRELFSTEELERTIRSLKNSGLFPDRGTVLTVQVSFATQETVSEMAGALSKLAHEDPDLRIVLLPIGLDHGDLHLLASLKEQMPGSCCLVRKEVTLQDVVAVIAHSALFAGTSLHGNIAACVYGVGNIFIAVPPYAPSKLIQCARLMGREDFVSRSADELGLIARAALRGNQYERSDQQCVRIQRRVAEHFDYLAGEIESAARRPRCIDASSLSAIHGELSRFFSDELCRTKREIGRLELRLRSVEGIAEASQSELTQIKATTAWRWLSRFGVLKHRYLLPVVRRLRSDGKK